MEVVAILVIILAIPAAVAVSILQERRARRRLAAEPYRGMPFAELDDPPDDRAKAMPALDDGR